MPKAKTSGISWLKLIAAILLCQIVGSIGVIFTTPSLPGWYAALNKPFFNPPNWLFGPVWTILYTFMGISLYLFWRKWPSIKKSTRNFALYAFTIQLALNPIWSFLFFGLKSPAYGFIGIVLLWISILITMVEFHKVSKASMRVLLPYICWVSFAAVLNLSILLLNIPL